MAAPIKDPNIIDWLSEILGLPVEILKQSTVGTVQFGRKTLWSIRVEPSSSKSSETLMLLEYEGEEAFGDIAGVLTTFNQESFVKSPLLTLKKLGTDTVEQLVSLDEISQHDRRNHILRLTLDKPAADWAPGSSTLEDTHKVGLGYAKIPFTSSLLRTGLGGALESTIILSRKANEASPILGRKAIEDAETRKFDSYKTFQGDMVKFAGTLEDKLIRPVANDNVNLGFSRIVIDELSAGGNFDQLISSPGTSAGLDIKKALDNHRDANGKIRVSDLTSNDNEMAALLGFSTPAAYRAAFPVGHPSRSYLERYIKAEKLRIMRDADDFAGEAIRHSLPNIFPNPADFDRLPQNVKDAWFDFVGLQERTTINAAGAVVRAGPRKADFNITNIGQYDLSPMKAADRVKKMSAVLEQYTLSGRVGKIPAVVLSGDLGVHIEHADAYHGAMGVALWDSDIEHQLNQELAELEVLFGVNTSQITDQIRANRIAAGKDPDAFTDRFNAAKKAVKVSEGLFFASTTREVFQMAQDDDFIKQVFVLGRFLSTMPFLNKGIRNPNTYMKYVDPFFYVNKVKDKVFGKDAGMLLALSFGEDDPNKLKWLAKNKRINKYLKNKVSVSYEGGTPQIGKFWKRAWIDPSSAIGLMPTGITNLGFVSLLSSIEENKAFLQSDLAGLAGHYLDPQHYLANPGALLELENALRAWNGGLVPANNAERLVYSLVSNGLISESQLAGFADEIGRFRGILGNDIFTYLRAKGIVPAGHEWKFIQSLIAKNKLAEFTSKYIGILNIYNRASNAVRDFIFEELLSKVGPLKSFTFLTPRGFSVEAALQQRFSQMTIISTIERFGIYLKGLSLTRFATRKIIAFFVKTLGKLIANLSGIISGGLSYALTFFGATIWHMVRGLFKGGLGGAAGALKEDIKTFTKTVKKVIVYPVAIACGCCLAPFAVFLFVIIAAGSTVTPFQEGTLSYGDVVMSKLVKVTKTGPSKVNGGDDINYTIAIRNISADQIEIESITDELMFTYACGQAPAGSAITVDVTAVSGLGTPTTDGKPGLPTMAFLSSTTIPAGGQIIIKVNLTGTTTKDGTYSNTVNVAVKGEDGRRATATASTNIGKGGCSQCPSGWPLLGRATVSQGPRGNDSHRSSEAVDFAIGEGASVVATHDGVVRAYPTTCAPDDHSQSCGYGNYIELRGASPAGPVITIYAHLKGFAVASGQSVTKGQLIGYSGHTGWSKGPHLHYEFARPGILCLGESDKPLRLRQFTGDFYVPVSIPVCVGVGDCNMSIP